ncbi:MAG: transcription antitermination factor NusB [Clostridia bacterium]|nr:transcription antitermination factor NusB [Clostridia bacterium]
MSRRDSREAAVKVIFQNEFIDSRLRTGDDSGENVVGSEDMIAMYISSAEENEVAKIDREFVKKVLESVLTNIKEIDEAIIAHIDSDWNINRLCKIDLAILREAIAEIRYHDDIPVSVTINEAVELAKKFSYPEAASFINGILGSVCRNE